MKKFLSLVLALVMTMSLVTISAGAKDFTDDSKITYEEAVDVISAVKVVDGYADGAFNPTATLTRGAAAKIICNLILGPTTAGALSADAAPYKDVPANSTFAGYIAYCAKEGIISGYADGTFRPGNTLTGYAFMKMLLGALGYDKAVEGYEGANWSINVAKRALNIGLNKGLTEDFNGVKPVTREEACLYAFNTLKATMVEYPNSSTIVVGDITISNSSKATEKVLGEAGGYNYIGGTTATGNKGQTVQFCEMYFPKLKLVPAEGADNFMRPANTWYYKGAKVGTYAKTPDLTYTKKVKLGDVFADLGLSKTITMDNTVATADKGCYYVDGVFAAAGADMGKGVSTKVGGQGALTEVFYDNDNNSVVVTVVNTYVGDVATKVAATSSKDAYVTIATRNYKSGSFETEDFKVDDVVLYTYSNKTNPSTSKAYGIQSVVKAESVTGTLTAITAGESCVVDGTTYEYANKIDTGASTTNLKYEVEVVLDTYGNAIDVIADKGSTEYAVVLKVSGSAGTYGDEAIANLLLTDGTVVKSVALTNPIDGVTHMPEYTVAGTDVAEQDMVSYKVNSKGEYTLTKLAGKANAANVAVLTNGTAAQAGVAASLTANGKTIFLVKTANIDGDAVYTAYVGIKNVPTIVLASATNKVTYYAKTTNLATVVYVDASASTDSIATNAKDAIFVVGSSAALQSDSVKGDYYTYDAIVNGQIGEISVKTANKTNKGSYGLYTVAAYDENGIAKLSSAAAHSNETGTVKENEGTIGLGGSTYVYAENCKVFYKPVDGDLEASSIAAIATDKTDKVWFTLNSSNEVDMIVIVQVVSDANAFTAKAQMGDVSSTVIATGAWSAATATGTVDQTIATSATKSVATDKTVTLEITGVSDGAVVTFTPASRDLVNGTTSYTFDYIATAESGKQATGTITVTFTSVGA